MTLSRLCVLVAVCLLAASQAAAQLTDLPARVVRDFFILPVAVHGDESRVLWMLYDTGASITVVDPESLAAVSSWEGQAGQRVNFTNITIGPVTLRDLSARTLDLDHISATLGFPIDGILAYWCFADYLVQLDYPQQAMRVGPGELSKVDGRTVFEITRKERRRPFVKMRLAGEAEEVLLDSGSGAGFAVRDRRGIPWVGDPVRLNMSMGINGPELEPSGRLDGSATICGKRFFHPLVRITPDTELVGTQVLRHFRWTFDRQNRRVEALAMNDEVVLPGRVLSTGVLRMPVDGAHQVMRVLDGSAAEQAGIRAGDRVLAVNGIAFDERGAEGIPSIPSDSGPTLIWTIQRDGEVLHLPTVKREVLPVPTGVKLAAPRFSRPTDSLWALCRNNSDQRCALWIDNKQVYSWPQPPVGFAMHPRGEAWAWLDGEGEQRAMVYSPADDKLRAFGAASDVVRIQFEDAASHDNSQVAMLFARASQNDSGAGLTWYRVGLGEGPGSAVEVAASEAPQPAPSLNGLPAAWSPDGQRFARVETDTDTDTETATERAAHNASRRIVVYDSEGRRLSTPVLADAWQGLSWSSDGHWILGTLAVDNDPNERVELWAIPVRPVQPAELLPMASDRVPLWVGWLRPAPK